MQRGRKPKPEVLKKLHGRPDKRRRKAEPKPPVAAIVPDASIDQIAGARACFEYLIATAPHGVIAACDVPLLEALAIAISLARQARENMVGGICVKDRDGRLVVNPYLMVASRQAEAARKLGAELSLWPSARARRDIPTPPQPSDGEAPDGEMDLETFLDQHPDRSLQ